MKVEGEQEKRLDHVSWYGKMRRVPFPATKEMTLKPSYKKLSGSFAKKPPLFLYLKTDGQKPDASMTWTGEDGALLGEFSMLSFGEFPSDVVESRLSQILEVSPHQKYYLSEKACLGILRRAEKRGKALPKLLEQALLDMIEFWRTGGGLVPYTLKVRSGCPGGGKGALVQTDKCATLSTLQDQTLFQPIPINLMIATRDKALGERTGLGIAKSGDPAFTISAAHQHAVFCLQGNGIGRADTAGCNGAGWNKDVCYTLNTTDRPAVAYEPKAVFDARGNGDGSTALTITGDHENRITDYTTIVCEKEVLAVDVYNNAITGAVSCSLTTATAQGAANTGPSVIERLMHWIVRRLTPLECERLQGFPDGWTDIGDWVDSKGKKHPASDSPRYKALGNSIALPSWFYVLRKLSLYCGLDCSMASLFDGIGGFPLIWESLNGKGSCLWASEIEEFPIAVTSIRFSEVKT